MSVDNITASLQTALKATGANFYLPGSTDFAGTLHLGQILKGKVLRHFEGGRYLVSFNGQEKVVDSAVPLRANEIIHGRVIGLGERVELQRIHSEAADVAAERGQVASKQPNETSFLGKHEALIERLFTQYAGKLSSDDRAILLRMVKSAADPDSMVTAGLVLSKLGLGQSPDFLRAVYEILLARHERQGLFSLPERAMQLSSLPGLSNDSAKRTAEQLSTLIAHSMKLVTRQSSGMGQNIHHAMQIPGDTLEVNDEEEKSGSNSNNEPSHRHMDIGQWVLNTQTQGAVSHRVGTIPFWLGKQLIEVDVAVFDQRPGTNLRNGVKHRQIVIALNLEHLGQIELTAKVAGDHLRVGITAGDTAKTEIVSSYMGQLRSSLSEAGWEIDEMLYATQMKTAVSGVTHSVVEHIVSQDSLNRLM